MPDAKGRKVLKVGAPQFGIEEMLNALYVSLYHNQCGLKIDAAGVPKLFMIHSGEVLGEFTGVAPRESIQGNPRVKKALEEMQYLLELHGYSFMRGNHYGRSVLLLCRTDESGCHAVAEIGQIIPDKEHPGADGIDWRSCT